ncbi:MAG: NfeD family protein [Pirellulaceae bacterium]
MLLLASAVLLLAGGADEPPAPDAPAPDAPAPDEPSVAESATQRAYLLPVALPIAGDVDSQVKRMVGQVVQQAAALSDGERPVVILEFRGKQGQSGAGSEFERSFSLARFLSSQELSRVRTVAYLPEGVEGHAVLPVLACEEIVMAGDADLGRAGIDEEFIEDTMRSAYREIAERRGVIPAPVALAMLDKNLDVLRVKTVDGVRYVTEPELKDLEKEVVVDSVDTISGKGEMADFTGYELRNTYRFVSHLAETPKELATALSIPPGGIEENPALGVKWRAAVIDLNGEVDAKWVQWVQRGIDSKAANGEINFVCIRIDSLGGFPTESAALANFLVELDASQVRTVAYVESSARADASLVALACDHLVVNPRAQLGGEFKTNDEFSPDELLPTIKALAEERNRDWSLMAALVDPELVVHRYTLPNGAERYFCKEELAEQENSGDWRQGGEIDTRGGVSGQLAEQLGLARYLAGDFEEVRALYHLEGEPETIEPSWAHSFIESLAQMSTWMAPTLLFIAVMALFSEASSPGLGVPGFVSIVCFVLFFWSQFLSGTADWLEILMFVTGLACVGVEIFLVPGMGVFGIGGGALIIASVVLASQTFVIPRTSEELAQLPYSLSMVLVSGAGAIVALVLVRHLLPRTRYGRHLMLQPPTGEDAEQLRRRESLVDWTHLVGQPGVAVTRLTPSGKAQFGDEVVAVISDGELLDPGTPVVVEEVLGNRVRVRPVGDADV